MGNLFVGIMKIYKIASNYLYHGTSEGSFRKIRENGLIPFDNKPIYLSNTEQYAITYAERKGNSYGNRVLRVVKTDDMIPDANTGYKGDFKTTTPIPPDQIEVKKDNVWVPIQSYFNEEIGIMQKASKTKTPEFKTWFGDWEDPNAFSSRRDKNKEPSSLAVDDKGNPKTYYHGTLKDFSEFEVGREGINSNIFGSWKETRNAIFFTPDPEHANAFTVQGEEWEGGNVIPVFLNVKSPLDFRDGVGGDVLEEFESVGINPRWLISFGWGHLDGEDGKLLVDAAKKLGYDAIIFLDDNPDTKDSFETWAIFDPSQIKSAIGNSGLYDKRKMDIKAKSKIKTKIWKIAAENEEIIYPNKEDYESNFWGHNFKITLGTFHSFIFIINASSLQDAIDIMIDWFEESNPSILLNKEQETEIINNNQEGEFISGGNHHRMLSFEYDEFHSKEIPPFKPIKNEETEEWIEENGNLKEQMMEYLKFNSIDPEEWKYDAEIAIYYFANDYHDGQNSELYSILSTSPYSPGPLSGLEKESEEVQLMYAELVTKFAPSTSESETEESDELQEPQEENIDVATKEELYRDLGME